MPRNGSGTYVLPPGNPVVPSTVIQTAWANTTMTDLANGLTGSLAKDGQTVPTANLPMGTFRHTGVGAATQATHYARADQVQANTFDLLTTVTGTNDYSGTLPLGTTTFSPGTYITMLVPNTNTGGCTLSINGGAAAQILTSTGQPVGAGVLFAGLWTQLVWSGTVWTLAGGALTASDITAALGYTPVNKVGDTMTGPLVMAIGLNSGNGSPLSFTTGDATQQMDLLVTRTGVVSYSMQAVQQGVGYKVLNLNPQGGQVTVGGGGLNVNGAISTLSLTATGSVGAVGFTPGVQTLAGTGSISVSWSAGSVALCPQTGPLTISSITNVPVGAMLRIGFSNTSAGAVTWPGNVVWPTPGTAPDLAAGSSKRAVVTLFNDSSVYLGNVSAY